MNSSWTVGFGQFCKRNLDIFTNDAREQASTDIPHVFRAIEAIWGDFSFTPGCSAAHVGDYLKMNIDFTTMDIEQLRREFLDLESAIGKFADGDSPIRYCEGGMSGSCSCQLMHWFHSAVWYVGPLLVDQILSINRKMAHCATDFHETPLHLICSVRSWGEHFEHQSKAIQIAKSLLNAGANINALALRGNYEGKKGKRFWICNTPLYIAVSRIIKKDYRLIAFLMNRGALFRCFKQYVNSDKVRSLNEQEKKAHIGNDGNYPLYEQREKNIKFIVDNALLLLQSTYCKDSILGRCKFPYELLQKILKTYLTVTLQ